MDVGLLTKFFGTEKQWSGSCTVIVDANANVEMAGSDALLGGGAKNYAPRIVSSRMSADAACLLHDQQAIVLLSQQRIRQATGEDTVKQQLAVVDLKWIVGVEFAETSPAMLSTLGLTAPSLRTTSSGVHSKPRIS